jgi:lipoprotein
MRRQPENVLVLVLVLFTSCLRIRALNIGCFFRLPTASQIARQSEKRFSGCISHRFSINRQPENHTVNPAANAYPKAQILFQVAFNERLPQSTLPAGAAEWNTIFREKRTKLFEQRSGEFFVRPKNRVKRGKFGAAKPATAVAFLLLPFLWRSKEKEVPRRHETHG